MRTPTNLLLVLLFLILAPLRVQATGITPAPDPTTVTVCPSGCQYTSLQAASNQPINQPITIKILGSLTGPDAVLQLGLNTYQQDLKLQCDPGVALDGAGADRIITGSYTGSLDMTNCTLQNVATGSGYLVNAVVKNATFTQNTYIGSEVRVTPNIQAVIDSNTFVSSRLSTGIGLPQVFNNTFNNLAGAPNLTAIRLFPVLDGNAQLYNNTINGYSTGVYFMNDKTFMVYNNIIANTGLGYYLHSPSVTVHTFNTLIHNVPVLRGGPGSGQDNSVFVGNPLFLDSSLRIRWQSPAVERGSTTLYSKNDKAGVKRQDSPDIGAYEGRSF